MKEEQKEIENYLNWTLRGYWKVTWRSDVQLWCCKNDSGVTIYIKHPEDIENL